MLEDVKPEDQIVMDRPGIPKSWTPTLLESLRFAWKPLVAFFLFVALGSLCLSATILYYDHDDAGKTALFLMIIFGGGLFGVLAGQVLALLRLRLLVFNIVGYILFQVLALTFGVAMLSGAGEVGAFIALGMFCFGMGLPCGLMSLHHRYELLATLWPAIGWIGSVFVIINEEGKAAAWEQDKLSAWMPVPLAMLGGFIFFLLVFLASKQTMRVELWQALSGAPTRRDASAVSLAAVPKRNLRWIIVSAALLFGLTALLSPYLFRTGRGDREGGKDGAKSQQEDDDKQGKGKKKGKGKSKQKQGSDKDQRGKDGDDDDEEQQKPKKPKFDEESLKEIAKQMANAAKKAVWALIPLLLLAIFFRPIKRLLLVSYLRAPWLPTTPSERVDNLWEYLRIKIEDTGVDLQGSDAVEEVVKKVNESGDSLPELSEAARIYMRARYDLVLAPNDSARMREVSFAAAKSLHGRLSWKARITIHWRALG